MTNKEEIRSIKNIIRQRFEEYSTREELEDDYFFVVHLSFTDFYDSGYGQTLSALDFLNILGDVSREVFPGETK